MDSKSPITNITAAKSGQEKRLKVRVRGLVQGVGFRPHVYKIALECQLVGWVRNDGEGVFLEIQGRHTETFLHRLVHELPPLARINAIETEFVELRFPSEAEFSIVESSQTAITTSIVPDAATCEECLSEALDPTNKRHLYPFLNCTHCGPRYSITKRLPYDRKQTSMAEFPMCDACLLEYKNPLDRRFHAQPTACPTCGPHLSHSVKNIVKDLREGKIVAMKGLGGFHLACDATNEAAVAALRERKNREAKPFAIMVANTTSAQEIVNITPAAKNILEGTIRPIVLLPKKEHSEIGLAQSVAPGMNQLGIMLPYTPLHHLIFHEAASHPNFSEYKSKKNNLTLVMTSANPGGEPLVIGNLEARNRLVGIADSIVTHNRDIVIRVDDSVVNMVCDEPFFVRRARGFVPQSIPLARHCPTILALGADLKNTVCVIRGNEAFVSQHIGDLDNVATLDFLQETITHLLSILDVRPELVACDLHPDFHSSRMAQTLGVPVVKVQHHHAHIAAVAAEHQYEHALLGVALDGFGLGTDGLLWGGEILKVDGANFERLGHFRPLLQPGGDKAAREPWRMACAALHDMNRTHEISTRFANMPHAAQLAAMLQNGFSAPPTTSCGRLFDAACGLSGIKTVAQYEGEAPMLFESLADDFIPQADLWQISSNLVIDWRPLLNRITQLPSPKAASTIFHSALACGLANWIELACAQTKLNTVALSGGCFLNNFLLTHLTQLLQEKEIRALIPRSLPPNDGGIALGQAWVAALSR